MSLSKVLQVKRKAKKMTLMQVVEHTGLSYGKVYRILNGQLEKPLPAVLKKLAAALDLDYHFLFELAGYITFDEKPTGYATMLPILTWEHCLLSLPFKETLHAGVSNQHFPSHIAIKDGFALEINKAHTLLPYFATGDILVCDPHASLAHHDKVLYKCSDSDRFYFGYIEKRDDEMWLVSFHQDKFDEDIELKASTSPVVAVIKTQQKAPVH